MSENEKRSIKKVKPSSILDDVVGSEEVEQLSLRDFIPDVSYQKVKLLSGQSISIRPWKMRELKDFLFALETQPGDQKSTIDQCIKLAKSCVDPEDHVVFNKLVKNDLLHLISHQRRISKGKVIDINFRCVNPKCPDFIHYDENMQKKTGKIGEANTLQEDKIDLDENFILSPFKNEPIKVGEFTFHTQELPYSRHRHLEDKYLDEKTPSVNKFTFSFIKDSIVAIEHNGAPIGFNPGILENFLDSMSNNDYELLSNSIIENLSTFSVEKTAKCAFCGDVTPILFDDLFSVLVF